MLIMSHYTHPDSDISRLALTLLDWKEISGLISSVRRALASKLRGPGFKWHS